MKRILVSLLAFVLLAAPAYAEEHKPGPNYEPNAPSTAQEEIQLGYGSDLFCYAGDRCDLGMFGAEVWFKTALDAALCPTVGHGTGRVYKVYQGRVRRLAIYWVRVYNVYTNQIVLRNETDYNTEDLGKALLSLTPNRNIVDLPSYLEVRMGIGIRWIQNNAFGTRILTSWEPFDLSIWYC